MAVNIMEDVTDARRAEHHQRFLAAASKLLSSSLDVDATLDRAAAAIVPELADWCCVDVPDERGRLQRRAIAAGPRRGDARLDARARGVRPRAATTAPPACSRDGRPRLLRATSTTRCCAAWARDDAAFERLRAAGLRSAIVVPLMAGDRPIGAMTLGDRRVRPACSGRPSSSSPQEVAVRAGVAVENARVHGVRAHIATTLQRSLLPPRLPAVPGMTIAARFRAAGEASEVGGDFYDLFSVDGAWMVVIGDVTGKGPEAASITSLARYTMRTAAVYEASPSGVLERLNAALVVDPDRRQICTVVAARIVAGADGSAVVTRRVRRAPRAVPPARRRAPSPSRRAGPLLGAFETGRWPETVGAPRRRARASCSTPTASPTRAAPAGRFGAERLAGRPGRRDGPRAGRDRQPRRRRAARVRGRPAARRRRAARPPGDRRAGVRASLAGGRRAHGGPRRLER